MSKDLEGVTRNNLEQMMQDQTDKILGAVEQHRSETSHEFSRVHDEISELRVTVDRIDQKHSEDIQTIYHEIALLKEHVGLKEKS